MQRQAGLARRQAAFDVAFGAWPLVHRRSFEAVSGPKVDWWLVNTVGVLLVSNGVVQWASSPSADELAVARRIGVGTALVLAAVDVTYAARRRISPVYLVDAVAELAWVTAWLGGGPRR